MSNRVARILGKVENTERFLRVALYQGIPGAAAKVASGPLQPALNACMHARTHAI